MPVSERVAVSSAWKFSVSVRHNWMDPDSWYNNFPQEFYMYLFNGSTTMTIAILCVYWRWRRRKECENEDWRRRELTINHDKCQAWSTSMCLHNEREKKKCHNMTTHPLALAFFDWVDPFSEPFRLLSFFSTLVLLCLWWQEECHWRRRKIN